MTCKIFNKQKKIIEVSSLESVSLDDLVFGSVLDPDESVSNYIIQHNSHSMSIMFGDYPLLLVSKFKLYKKIKKAYSSASQAMYLGWKKNKEMNTGFLIHYLPPHSITSNHYHQEQTEIFHTLEGEFFLKQDGSVFSMPAGQRQEVKPYSVHQLFTKDNPSLTVIEILNVNYKDHVMVEQKNRQMERD